MRTVCKSSVESNTRIHDDHPNRSQNPSQGLGAGGAWARREPVSADSVLGVFCEPREPVVGREC